MAAAGAEGRTMRRDRPAVPKQSGFACGLGSSDPLRLGSAAGHALPLTKGRSRSSVSGVDRTYLGNVGQDVVVSPLMHTNIRYNGLKVARDLTYPRDRGSPRAASMSYTARTETSSNSRTVWVIGTLCRFTGSCRPTRPRMAWLNPARYIPWRRHTGPVLVPFWLVPRAQVA
jgi:hypothetical protein